MRKLRLLLPFLGLVICANLAMANECSERLEAPVFALFQIIKLAAEKGLVSAESLHAQFSGEGWTNPFGPEGGTTATSGYRRAFTLHSEKFDHAQKQKFREMVLEFAGEGLKSAAESQQASEETRALLAPRIFTQLPAEYSPLYNSRADLTWYQGRPVLIGPAGLYQKTRTYFADLFNPDPKARLILDLERNETVNARFGNAYGYRVITLDGKEYVFSEMNRRMFEMPSGREPYAYKSRLSAPSDPKSFARRMSPAGSVMVDVDGDTRVVTGWINEALDPDARSYLAIVSLKGAPSRWEKIANGITVERPRAFRLDGHSVISWHSETEGLRFIDLSDKNKIYPAIELPAEDKRMDTHAVAYNLNGEWRALFIQKPVHEGDHKFTVADIKTGKPILDIPTTATPYRVNSIGYVEIGGKPYAYAGRHGDVLWMDLTTNTSVTIPAPGLRSGVSHFLFQGVTYLIYVTEDGGLAILEPILGQTHVTELGLRRVEHLFPFNYRGLLFVYLVGYDEPTRLVELLQEP